VYNASLFSLDLKNGVLEDVLKVTDQFRENVLNAQVSKLSKIAPNLLNQLFAEKMLSD
jgi:hypothetical protein